MISIYSKELTRALDIAEKIAKENSHAYYSGSHLLKALLNRDLSLLKQLEKSGKDVYYLEEWAEVRMENVPKGSHVEPQADKSLDEILIEAESVRFLLEKEEVDLYSVLVALATPGVAFSYDQMKSFPISRNELLEGIKNKININNEFQDSHSLHSPITNSNSFISKYCIPIKLDSKYIFVGREAELNSMVEILSRFVKPNVLLLGDHGIGKTSLINGFCQLVTLKKVPELLIDSQIFKLDLSALIAGTSYKGEIEDRLRNISLELRNIPKSILIIEEIHSLMDKNGNNSGIVNLLKAEMLRGLTIIASSTLEDFSKRMEAEQSLVSMFEILKIEEVDDEMNFRIIKKVIKQYEEHHKITVNDDAILEAVKLSKRYLKEKSLPESAIDLIDHTMSVLKTAGEIFLKEKSDLYNQLEILEKNELNLRDEELYKEANWFLSSLLIKNEFLLALDKSEIKDSPININTIKYCYELLERIEKRTIEKRANIESLDLALIISKKTGIPIGKLQDEEKKKLVNIKDILKMRIVGQDHALETVSESILESRAGLSKAGQPTASFFFLGPTGTGKTELAKSLADFLFQDENAIIRFDMSEFKEEHSAALLYGAPPGYVGYEEGGLLVNKIRQKPYSIVLFDEIEKAHASVFDVFLQIMDEGKLHDRLGKEGDFSNALILFTSNIGSDFIIKSFEDKKEVPSSNHLMEIMANYFRPEFLGRLTEIIPFAPISKENALKIFEIHLKKEFFDLLKNFNFQIHISDEAKVFLTEKGFNSKYGARPLKGIIRNQLRRPLAKKIISGEISDNDIYMINVEDQQLIWNKIIQ